MENVPVICGGFTDNEEINKFCYTIKNNSEPVSELQFHRISSAAIKLSNDSLWITGGQKIDETNWKTTEIVSLTQPSRPGPELPIEISDHCMVSYHFWIMHPITYLVGYLYPKERKGSNY